jgi:hypothetical protein
MADAIPSNTCSLKVVVSPNCHAEFKGINPRANPVGFSFQKSGNEPKEIDGAMQAC